MANRKNEFDKATRAAILEAYNFTCAACGCSDPAFVESDHFVPMAKGGESTESNGIALCGACNRAKGALVIPAYYKLSPRFPVSFDSAMNAKLTANRAAFAAWLEIFKRAKPVKNHPKFKFVSLA